MPDLTPRAHFVGVTEHRAWPPLLKKLPRDPHLLSARYMLPEEAKLVAGTWSLTNLCLLQDAKMNKIQLLTLRKFTLYKEREGDMHTSNHSIN